MERDFLHSGPFFFLRLKRFCVILFIIGFAMRRPFQQCVYRCASACSCWDIALWVRRSTLSLLEADKSVNKRKVFSVFCWICVSSSKWLVNVLDIVSMWSLPDIIACIVISLFCPCTLGWKRENNHKVVYKSPQLRAMFQVFGAASIQGRLLYMTLRYVQLEFEENAAPSQVRLLYMTLRYENFKWP